MAAQEKVKVTVSLPQDTVDVIKELASKHGVTASELLRRSVATEKFFDEVERDNGKILVERGNKIQEIIRR